MSEILTLSEAAARLRITHKTLNRWRAAGTAPQVTKLGPRRRGILVADLEAWIAAQGKLGVPPKARAAR